MCETLKMFLKEYFEQGNVENICSEKLPSMQRVDTVNAGLQRKKG